MAYELEASSCHPLTTDMVIHTSSIQFAFIFLYKQ